MARSKTSPKEKLNGTVRLLKQSLQLILVMVVAGLLTAAYIDYAIGLIITGVGLFAIGGTIVQFRRLIWDSYQKDFSSLRPHGFKKILLSPSLVSYHLNVYVLWPVVMLVGVVLTGIGVFSRL